jgi:hypothetical protein
MGRKVLYYTLLIVFTAYIAFRVGIYKDSLQSNSSEKVAAIQKSPLDAPEAGKKIDDEETEKKSVETEEVFYEVFEIRGISSEVKEKIYGHSWKEGAPVTIENLRHVTVSYWGFDDNPHLGELIVHEKVAQEVVDIFNELYKVKYPIEKIRLIDEYGSSDELSMKDNNSSAFCYRDKTSKKSLSKHSYGLAVDINPVQNPYIKGNDILPAAGKAFLDRNNIRKGMIVQGDDCYEVFKSRGWTWGGEWTNLKDYQHFEKDIKQ